jgi:hypothetical protein
VRLLLALAVSFSAFSQDAREIVRRSVSLDQTNWIRRADYTWTGHSVERHFDAQHRVTSQHSETWETVVLDGRPYERTLDRDGRPLPASEQRKQQEKLDRITAQLQKETAEQKQRHADDYANERRRDRAFLLEIPDAFDLKLEGSDTIDGRDVWVVSGNPKPAYQPKSRDGAALLKITGKLWIDKAEYQWVRIEAQTIKTISLGLILAWMNPGAKLVLEQTRVNDELWLPSHEYLSGSGRIGLVKRLAEDDDITWSDYRKFRVDSKLLPGDPK